MTEAQTNLIEALEDDLLALRDDLMTAYEALQNGNYAGAHEQVKFAAMTIAEVVENLGVIAVNPPR